MRCERGDSSPIRCSRAASIGSPVSVASSKQPPQQGPPPGARPGGAPPAGAARPAPYPPAPAPPPSSAAAHAADLERQIRRRSWIAGLAIVLALAAAGVALYFALDTRDNSVTKDELPELIQKEQSATTTPTTQLQLATVEPYSRLGGPPAG